MSSTERAPEPTMEEILASIRRIISEDEAGTEQQPPRAAAASSDDEDHLEVVEGEADDKIINDIARVLSGGAPAPVEEPAEDAAAEDILDLTAELGGLEPVETLELVEELEIEEFVLEEPLELEPEPEPVAAPVELETPVAPEPEPEPEPVLEAAPPEPEPAPVAFEPPQRKLSASEEAASALERAIAALRAGQVPTSAPPPPPSYMSAPAPQIQPVPPPTFGAEPQPAPGFIPPQPTGFIPSPEPQLEAAPEPAPEPEPEPELVLTEFEIETTETLVFEASPSEALPAEPEETAPEPDYMAPLTNGSGPHVDDLAGASALPEGSKEAIEESIKDILRPMLRQWLDENMARVVTAALKDEIREHPARFQSD